MRSQPFLLCLLGPTAVGKTALALPVAERLEAEIISADSKQVYRYMDIGTAKPTPEERARVPHHGIDWVDPDERFSAADFQRLADAAIQDIVRRGKRVMVVGGSGLYFRALVDGLFEMPRSDPTVRERLKQELASQGKERMHLRLAEVDPEAARRIHVNDVQRILRALEVYEVTGIPISQHQRQWQGAPRYPFRAFVLHRPRQELYARIDQRVDAMLARGWLDEVQRLIKLGYREHLISMDSFGYRELMQYLSGELTWEEAVERIKRQTRRFAKRQLTWFRGDPRLEWLDLATLSEEAVIQRLVEVGRRGASSGVNQGTHVSPA